VATKIEWATESWNPITGCSKISPGCANCYAERMAKRLAGRFGYPADDPFAVTLHESQLKKPLKWRKPRMVFVCSMGDLFHEDVPFEWISLVISNAASAHRQNPKHKWLFLTKRPERILAWREWVLKTRIDVQHAAWFQHVAWIGVTTDSQEQADKRIPILLQIPAAVRFVSAEPMLGPVDLNWVGSGAAHYDCLHGANLFRDGRVSGVTKIDWVICGGESGPGARPMHPGWARSLRDQCLASAVPFFFKQWGQWEPVCKLYADDQLEKEDGRGELFALEPNGHFEEYYQPSPDAWLMESVGKKKSGRLLDGREWNQYPEVTR